MKIDWKKFPENTLSAHPIFGNSFRDLSIRVKNKTYSDRDRDRDFFGDSDRRLFDRDRLRDFERLFDRLLDRRTLRQQVLNQ